MLATSSFTSSYSFSLRKSLVLRCLLSIFLLSTIVLGVTGSYFIHYYAHQAEKQLSTAQYRLALITAEALDIALWNFDSKQIEEQLNAFNGDVSFCGARVLDPKNVVINTLRWETESLPNDGQSLASQKKHQDKSSLIPHERIIGNKHFFSVPILYLNPNYPEHKTREVLGSLELCADYTSLKQTLQQESLMQFSVLVMLVVVITAICLMSLRFIINPLLQIREAMQRLPDTMQPIDAPNLLHPNEVGYLTYSFNQMVEKLRTASDSLVIAKQQAEAANIAKSDFLSQMSHELRTPMHAILNYSNIGLKSIGMEDTSRLTKSLTNINTAGMRLLAMINDLLDLSKLEAGKMQINLAPVDVMSLLHKTLEELDALLKPKALSVVVKDELLRKNVMADADRLVQVLVNLLSNAIRYSAEHGTITIILNNTPVLGKEGFVLSVENNGTLIPEEDLKMIFERFIQSASARSMAGTTGLGLAICREILQVHQGEIWAENIQPNTVRFSLFIPEENDACAIV